MFVIYKDDQSIITSSNTPQDAIDWPAVYPGKAVFMLSEEDYRTTLEWLNAGTWSGGEATKEVADAQGKQPGDVGYVVTLSEGKPDTWSLSGNSAQMVKGGTVELLTSTFASHAVLTATAVLVDLP